MKQWLRISLLLCTFGFFREMRPSEPFVTEFFTDKRWRNITIDQVNRDIYPLGTYSYLAQLIIIFLITDILRYKPIIILSACAGISMFSFLLWTSSLLGLQFCQLCYGTYMSSEIAYYTYIYAKVDRDKYQQVTGHTRSAFLCGRFLGSVFAQLAISYNILDFRELHYISFASQILSLGFGLMLPSVDTSLYFYNSSENEYLSDSKNMKNIHEQELNFEIGSITSTIQQIDKQIYSDNNTAEKNDIITANEKKLLNEKPKFSWNKAVKLIYQHIYGAYSNPIVIQWSIWWSLAMCGYLLVASYVQLLWKQIDPEHENFYNGAVEAGVTLLGAIGAFSSGFLNSVRYQKWDLWILTICSLLEGGFLVWAGLTQYIEIAYTLYIIFGGIYFFMITTASAMVAKNLVEDSFGLIFGINTLLALILQSIFTLIVISDSGGFELDARQQHITFGGYFIILSFLYGITGFISSIRSKCVHKK